MKLLIDGRPIRDPISGSAVFVIELFRALNKKLHNVDVFLQSNRFKNRHIDLIPKKNSIISNSKKSFENVLYEFGFNNNIKCTTHYDIGHQTYFARLPFNKTKSISTIHDVIPLDFPDWFSWKNSLFARRNFYHQITNSNVCVFSSKFTEQRAFYHSDIKCFTTVIPLAVSDKIHEITGTYVNNSIADPVKIINGQSVIPKNFILMVGNIEPRKNIQFVSKALKIFNDRFNLNIELVLAGRGNYKTSEILHDANKILGKSPIVLGFVSDSDKNWLYQNCAIHIFASSYEGFGLPPVESIVVGSPTLISANSSLNEIIPSKLLSFDSTDIDSLVLSIESIIFKDSHSIIGDSLNKYINYYKWDRVASDYMILYKNMLAGHYG